MNLPKPTWLTLGFLVLAYGASFDRRLGLIAGVLAGILAGLSMKWPRSWKGNKHDDTTD